MRPRTPVSNQPESHTEAPFGADRERLNGATKVWKRPIERIAYRRDEAAATLGIGTTKLDDWVKRKILPPPVRIDDVVLYDAEGLRSAWADIVSRARDGLPDREGASVDLSAGWNARSGL